MSIFPREPMPLFDQAKPKAPAVARRRDPSTSHEAAERMNRRGTTGEHEAIILSTLRRLGRPSTNGEIAACCELDFVAVARRMAGLEKAGEIERLPKRVCTVKQTAALVWRLT